MLVLKLLVLSLSVDFGTAHVPTDGSVPGYVVQVCNYVINGPYPLYCECMGVILDAKTVLTTSWCVRLVLLS